MVVLIFDCPDAVCRVHCDVVTLHLIILYLRTCVGLGYGNEQIHFLNQCILIVTIRLVNSLPNSSDCNISHSP